MNGETTTTTPPSRQRMLAVVEIALIFLVLFIFAGSPPPGDDEVHYLGKAKQYWNPDWLAGDFFLETADAHIVFNWTVGWLTLFASLSTTAWIARCTAWLLLAVAWRRFSWCLLPRAFVALLTMCLFLVFQEHGTAAREWIVRGVEAKCFAYVFVVLGLERIVRGDWRWVWPLLGIAAAFHVLVGGWAVVAAMLAWAMTNERAKIISMLPWLVVGGLFSLLGVIPGLMLNWKANPDVVQLANQIYVFDRLSHHLVAHHFLWRYILQFAGALLAWLTVCFLTRRSTSQLPLRRFVLGTIAIGIVGIVVEQATMHDPALCAGLLRFYWYRLPDMMVPIGLAFALAEGVLLLERTRPRLASFALVALIAIPAIVLSGQFAQQRADPRPTADIQGRIGNDAPREYEQWVQTCAWIETNTRPDARFLTPPNVTSFRWYAQRSEVVSWKDIPQNATGIVEWRERLRATQGWWAALRRKGPSKSLLKKLALLARSSQYDFEYVILSRSDTAGRLPLPLVYTSSQGPDPAFDVYRLPEQSE